MSTKDPITTVQQYVAGLFGVDESLHEFWRNIATVKVEDLSAR